MTPSIGTRCIRPWRRAAGGHPARDGPRQAVEAAGVAVARDGLLEALPGVRPRDAVVRTGVPAGPCEPLERDAVGR